jgi:hypothetical protein
MRVGGLSSGGEAPLAEVPEREARGGVKKTYEDIKRVLGVPAVNLLFRHFATIPGCLEWAWAELRPHYLSGAVPDAAALLASAVALPRLERITPDELERAGVDREALETVRQILGFYISTNPINLVGLEYLLARSRGEAEARGGSAEPWSGPRPTGAAPRLPHLVELSEMGAPVHELVLTLSARSLGGVAGVIPSVYRHLAHWPGLLELIERRLGPSLDAGLVQTPAEALERAAATAAGSLPGPRPAVRPRPLTAEARERFEHFAESFPATIARMIVIARLVAQALP